MIEILKAICMDIGVYVFCIGLHVHMYVYRGMYYLL